MLAGSSAIREHGLIDRPTEDIDLFTSREYNADFEQAVSQVTAALEVRGIAVETQRIFSEYARLKVTLQNRQEISIDLGIDWRGGEPIVLDIGPVLALSDSIGNKAAALYSRGEPRDFLDVDSIRQSGVTSDEELENSAAAADLGFDREMFILRLETVTRITLRDVAPYGITEEDLTQIRARFLAWAQTIRAENPGGPGE